MMSNGGVIELDPLPLPIYIKVEGINVQVPSYGHTRPRPILPQFIPNLMYLCSEYNLADLSYQSVERVSTYY